MLAPVLVFLAFALVPAGCALAQEGTASGEPTGGAGGLYISPVWLALVAVCLAGWLYIVSWINTDAKGIGLKSPRWVTVFMGGGLVGALLTFLIHPSLVLLMVVGIGAGFLYYLSVRNAMVPVSYQILGQWLGGEGGTARGGVQAEEGSELPHVDVEMTNPEGRRLADLISSRPDFAGPAELLGDLVAHAVDRRATDLRIEPAQEGYNVLLELDGVMHRTDTIQPETGRAIIGGMAKFLGFARKSKAEAEITANVPDEGEVEIVARGLKAKQRPAIHFSLPDWHTDVYRGGLEGLGMREEMVEKLHAAIDTGGATLLFSGPPQSGRTSTYHAAIGHIDIFTTDVMVLETEAEHELDQVRRREVDVGSEEEMGEELPAVFRESPDVIGVDEVTNPGLIMPLLEFATEGGRLLATIEAKSAPQALARLVHGTDKETVSNTIQAVTCQRLIRLLCDACKEEVEPNRRLLKKLKIKPSPNELWYRPVGCEQCMGVGYRGRTALYELLIVDDRLRKLITTGKAGRPDLIKKVAAGTNLTTLYQDALAKVRQGRTTLKEMRRVLK
jgi:general secretion pathway protein E